MGLADYRIILASSSPRRSELLTKSDIPFEVRIIDTVEEFPDDLSVDEVALYIAELKANAHKPVKNINEVIIVADTVVAFDGKIYGKARSKEDAVSTLLHLSGRTHQVYTGVIIFSHDREIKFTVKSDVKFAAISKEEASFYFEKDVPMDKAGSYGIQDWIGWTKVEYINGSYSNILGLPMAQTYSVLLKFCESK